MTPPYSMSRICNRENVVWAKVRGYRPWPARIVDETEREQEPTYKLADEYREQGDDVLVRFFGTNEIAWVTREKAITTWKSGLNLNYHNRGTPGKLFKKGLAEVRQLCSERSGIPFDQDEA